MQTIQNNEVTIKIQKTNLLINITDKDLIRILSKRPRKVYEKRNEMV